MAFDFQFAQEHIDRLKESTRLQQETVRHRCEPENESAAVGPQQPACSHHRVASVYIPDRAGEVEPSGRFGLPKLADSLLGAAMIGAISMLGFRMGKPLLAVPLLVISLIVLLSAFADNRRRTEEL